MKTITMEAISVVGMVATAWLILKITERHDKGKKDD